MTDESTQLHELAARRYAFGEEIARGGMGAILRAGDTVLNRTVAVKVLHERFDATSSAARRFVDEARITAQLQHPGIPAVHDLGTLADGRPFLAMKLIEGRTLDELLNADTRSLTRHGSPEHISIFAAICQAVAFAHSRGIIHRDLKPANVMVGAFGEVQVMDWGLAKTMRNSECGIRNEERTTTTSSSSIPHSAFRTPHFVADDPDRTTDHSRADASTDERTQSGHALGTPAYMPPEQARGELDRIDRRADVFALGGVLCAILTGKGPYSGRTSAEVVAKAANAELGDTFARLDGCGADAELIALSKRCLSADPAARPADAGEVAALVARYRAEVERRLRTAERERAAAEAKAVEQRKKRRVQLALAAAVLVIAAGGGAFAWYSERQASVKRSDVLRNADALANWVERCEAALKDEDADTAEAALQEIDRRVPDGGGDALAERIALCRADVKLLRELDDVDHYRWSPLEGVAVPERKQIADRWRTAFAAAGIDPGTLPPMEAALRINASPLRERLLTTLEMWLLHGGGELDIRAILHAADPDPIRDVIRDAVQTGDEQRITALVDRPQTLTQPPPFTIALGQFKFLPSPLRRAVLESALQARPGRLAVLMNLENTYYYDDKKASAPHRIRWLQAAVTANPRVALAHYNLAIALNNIGDHAGAAASYRTAIRLAPKYTWAYQGLGGTLNMLGDRDGAVAAYRQALALDPNLASAYHGLGNALYAKNDVDGAIAAYREAIRIEPNKSSAHALLGNALQKKGDYAGAVAACREAIRINPATPQAHYFLGIALFKKGDAKEAVAAFREAVRLEPTEATAHYMLGLALQAHGDADEAIAAFREAVRLNPKYASAHASLGYALYRKGELDGAIAAYRDAIRLEPTRASTHYNLGLALADRGDDDGAIAEYREAIRLDPTDASYHRTLGNALDAKGDAKGAIAAYRDSIRLDPKNANVHSNLGATLYESGDVAGGIASFREAIRLNPKHAAAHCNLGSALMETGDLDAAIACFETAVRLEPKNAQYKSNLADARKRKAERDATPPVAPPPREAKR